MVLTAAERAKRYRDKIKQDPEKYEQHKKKELERLKRAQKKIIDLTDEEKNERRKKWREQKKRQKEQKKGCQRNPLPQVAHKDSILVSHSFKVKYRNLRRNYKTAVDKIQKYKKELNNLRKKLYREKKKHEQEIMSFNTEKDKLQARQEILELSLREVYSDCKKPVDKRLIKKLALKIGEKSKTYPDRKLLGLKGQIRTINKSKRSLVNEKILSEMEKFYNRDDISRSTAGKKETRTRKKKKMQIRYLVDTLKNLYQIYRDEGGKYSYITFFRYKPFYVLSPSSTCRDTCMCIKHSNVEFMISALKLKGVITHTNTSECLKNVACDTKSFNCMYNKCKKCETPRIQYSEDKLQDEITWYKWVRVNHIYKKSGRDHITKKTVKQEMKGIVCELITEFEKQLKLFKTHVFNWGEQHRQYRACVTNLTAAEIVILCDFSENFDCKYSNEIQSMHFGASKNSITLHTGVMFGKDFSQSFVTLCDDNCHEPNAIWAHLLPVIKQAKEMNPDMKIIHYFSDGPSSQYRQKKNFLLLNLLTQKLKLSYATWSFSEAGHGKSLADGIGGSVKRQLDKRVTYGEDITNATDAHQILQRTMTAVKSFYISSDDVKNMQTLIPERIRAVPGTMQLHQVISAKPNQIEYRKLSCFCGDMHGLCSCYGPKTHILVSNHMMEKLSSAKVPMTAANTESSLINVPSVSMALTNLETSEILVPTGTTQLFVTDPVLRQSQTSTSGEPSVDTDFVLEQTDIALIESAMAPELERFEYNDLPVHPRNITIPSLLENEESYKLILPIEDVADQENVPSNHLMKRASAYSLNEPYANNQLEATSRVDLIKMLKPLDAYRPPEVSPPFKRVITSISLVMSSHPSNSLRPSNE